MEAQNVAGKGGDADALFLVAQDAAKDEAQIRVNSEKYDDRDRGF